MDAALQSEAICHRGGETQETASRGRSSILAGEPLFWEAQFAAWAAGRMPEGEASHEL